MDAVRAGQRTDQLRRDANASHPALPSEMPLDMVEQSLWLSSAAANQLPTNPRLIWLRRALVLGGTIFLTAVAAYQMYLVVTVNGPTVLQAIVLVLYVALFAWIAFSFMTMLIGFVLYVFGRSSTLAIRPEKPLPKLTSRCALLVPTYNETPHRLFARVQAIFESVQLTGQIAHFDFFVLSDTTNPEIWIAEEREYLQIRSRSLDRGRIFYRHRPSNEGRKAGNIAEWIKRFGGAYDSMIVLDADSLMIGDTIVRLVDAMERYPLIGLIQTLPTIVNAHSLFARLQQFAGRVYGPLVAHGISWWHGAEGNYWGHNAIIRVRAFAESAGLPTLRGPKPFGGPIMSHDFVEAALMRRKGWAVHLAPGLGGSYEEAPPSLDAYAIRARRWCQGNLQHIGVLSAKGLHWVSRLHLLTGIGSYITAPMWLCFLLLGVLISLQAHFIRPEYFAPGFSLFPRWPTEDPYRAALVFIGTMGILVIPKLLGLIAFVVSPASSTHLRGLIPSVLIETVISGLLAPVMMWKQTVAVIQILLGKDVGWSAQQREGLSIPFKITLRRYSSPTGLGLVLAIAAYAVSLPLFWWMSPVIVGLLLTIPLERLTSSAAFGRAVRRLGFLAIPEERTPPSIVDRFDELTTNAKPVLEEQSQLWRELLTDSQLSTIHRDLLSEPRLVPRGQIDVDLVVGLAKLDQCTTIDEALEILTSSEKRALLGNREAFDRLKALQKDQ
jgi:membrane glycosyltransferase